MANTLKLGAGLVLFTLAVGQFLMTLDSSVMNVSMVSIAADTNTTITGIQTAITLYTLVMASFMITGGKIGARIGHLKAFRIGCLIYGAGSLLTGFSNSLFTLLIGWSLLEGLGAALIMPAIVALVAKNFVAGERPKAYGLIASAGAIAMALGPLIGGFATTFFSWRWVFISEVILVLLVLVLSRKMVDTKVTDKQKLDLVGTFLSVFGLGIAVFAILRASEWGWILAKREDSGFFGLSFSFWLFFVGVIGIRMFFWWESKVLARGEDPLVKPDILKIRQLQGGLIGFFFQFLLQAGVFFIIPLFLSVVLELSAIETGLRVLPLSISVLLAAIGIPRIWPEVSPRLVVRIGILLMLSGILTLLTGIDINADASVVAIPMFLLGLGMGSLSSQLGSVTVSAVPTERNGEVGGLQNTATNLGASLGTALAGSIVITVLASTLIMGVQENTELSTQTQERVSTQLTSDTQFVSNSALEVALSTAGTAEEVTNLLLAENTEARLKALDSALAVLALFALIALFFVGRIPEKQPK
jgi:EmrB/QacA subfamily drug resistance transporter